MTVRHFIVPGLVASLFLFACGDEPKPAAAVVPPPAANKPVVADAQATADAGTANETPAYVYAYSPVGKRDPFRSPIVDHPVNEQGPQCENAGPLGSWGLDQLTLVATVTSDANPIGMVEDPGGKGYIIRRNTPVGSMCGKVTEVLRDCVTITEYYPTPDGKRVPNPKKLCLKSDLDQKGDVDLNTGKPIQ